MWFQDATTAKPAVSVKPVIDRKGDEKEHEKDKIKRVFPTFFRIMIMFLSFIVLMYIGFIAIQHKMYGQIRAQLLKNRASQLPSKLDESISAAANELEHLVRN